MGRPPLSAGAGTSAVQIPLLSTVTIDGNVLAFTLALAVAAGLVMGVVPARRASRTDPVEALKGA